MVYEKGNGAENHEEVETIGEVGDAELAAEERRSGRVVAGDVASCPRRVLDRAVEDPGSKGRKRFGPNEGGDCLGDGRALELGDGDEPLGGDGYGDDEEDELKED